MGLPLDSDGRENFLAEDYSDRMFNTHILHPGIRRLAPHPSKRSWRWGKGQLSKHTCERGYILDRGDGPSFK
jgi:hypothetical protein